VNFGSDTFVGELVDDRLTTWFLRLTKSEYNFLCDLDTSDLASLVHTVSGLSQSK